MKKLNLFLTLVVLFSARPTHCSAAHKARTAFQWIKSNSAGLVALGFAVPTSLHGYFNYQDLKNSNLKGLEKLEQNNKNAQQFYFNDQHRNAHQELVKLAHKTAQEHEIPHCSVITSPIPESTMAACTVDGKNLIIIDPLYIGFNDIENLKSVIVHEIGHLKNHHTEKTVIYHATINSFPWRVGLATTACLAIQNHITSRMSPRIRLLALGASIATIIGTALADTSELDRTFQLFNERQADRYVVTTAFKNRDPKLLDAQAAYFSKPNAVENKYCDEYVQINFKEDNTHPTNQERYKTAKAAAQKLRDQMAHPEWQEPPYEQLALGL